MGSQNGKSEHDAAPKSAEPSTHDSRDISNAELDRLRGRFPLKRFIVLIASIGALVIVMIAYSAETGLRMSQHYTPLIDAAMKIKLEATTAHLWFEELNAHDPDANMDMVRKHIDQADWYAHAILNGGTNAKGTFIPIDDPQLRKYIKDERRLLAQFLAKMEQGHLARRDKNAPPHTDQTSDRLFQAFIEMADTAQTRLQSLIKAQEKRFVTVQIILALTALTVMSVLGILFVRFADTQNTTVVNLRREISRRIRVESTLRKQATTDTLTGLLNRRRMTDILQDELSRAKRIGTPFSIILFDIDHFKRVNDTYGHEAGDNVLKQIAATVKSRLRELDAFSRWGGEEFLILLRGTEMDGALELSTICCDLLALHKIDEIGCITASFGVATYRTGETVRELIHRADDALYKAKNNGRNCVVMSKVS